MRARCLIGAVLALLPVAASASETIKYSYDAKGRLVKVAHCDGTVQIDQCSGANVRLAASYTFDAADNRTTSQVTGAHGRVIVVTLNGFTPIIIR